MQQKAAYLINLDEFNKHLNEPLKKGDSWYLVAKKWYTNFLDFNQQHHNATSNSENLENIDAAPAPGPINNESLLVETKETPTSSIGPKLERQLKEDLQENDDFMLVPYKCWTTLKDTYGIIDPSHVIERTVIESGAKHYVVELYPLHLTLCIYGAKDNKRTQSEIFSRSTTLIELENKIKHLFFIDHDKQTKLWINSEQYSSNAAVKVENGSSIIKPPTPLPTSNQTTSVASSAFGDIGKSPSSSSTNNNVMSSTLQDVGVTQKCVVTLEVINQDGTWPSCRPRYGASTRSTKTQPGLCGLSNMGNTCFMNAALQCLSNTPPLTRYILEEKFLLDINVSNPLGMKGEIARTYAELIKVLWSGNCASFLPREFKCAVGTFAPQFTGFAQQDCQELMAFLLDGLHEDLNRIKTKPYIEMKNDIETRPDEVVAAESWSNYKKRNDSIVVDTFHGLLKSTLVCPGCNLVSVTFDPFCYLTLPLPQKRDRQYNVSESTTNDNKDGFADAFLKHEFKLEDCITQFTHVERLGADDPWYCPKCKKHQQATKKFDIWSLPKVLIIHMKRFSFSRSWRDKIDTLIQFPLENLDMSKYVLNSDQKDMGKLTYNLIGVANHFGGLGGGHYTAYAKNEPLDSWYTFDDATVSSMSPSSVVTKSAYVLFYQLQQ